MTSIRYSVVLVLLFLSASVLYSSGSRAQTWTKEKSLPWAASDASIAFSIGNYIYCGGGGATKTFYRYDPATNTWTKKANLPSSGSALAFGVAFTIGNKGYVGTGQQTPGDQTSVSNQFWSYDTAMDKWTAIASLPGVGRDGAFGFAVGGKAYVGGGIDPNTSMLADFYGYDPSTDTWTQLGDLPAADMFFATTFAIGDYAYMATETPDTIETMATFRYDPTTDSWDTIAPFPGIARQAAVGFSMNELGYVGLGEHGFTTGLSDFYSYDPKTNIWSAVAGPAGFAEAWSCAAATSTVALVGGGWDMTSSTSFTNNCWVFTPTSSQHVAEEEQAAQLDLSVTPNPFSSATMISLQAPTAGLLHIEIVDLLGRVAYESNINSVATGEKRTIQFDAGRLGLSGGVYYLRASIGNTIITRQMMNVR